MTCARGGVDAKLETEEENASGKRRAGLKTRTYKSRYTIGVRKQCED